MTIEIISGSPRANSLTNRIAIHLAKILKENTDAEIGVIDIRDHKMDFIQQVISSPDGAPEQHRDLSVRMFEADAFIIVTPEYNGSFSPAVQNLFDHFPKQSHKAFAIVTGSPGALGGIRAAMQLQQYIMGLFGIPSPHMLITPQVDKKFDEDGSLLDASFGKSINSFVNEFLWLAERLNEKIAA